MELERYQTEQQSENAYLFYSEGENGYFPMLVSVDRVFENKQIFNLALLVLDKRGKWSDRIETKNGDDEKILATAGVIGLEFLAQNPDATLIAAGTVIKDKDGNDLPRKRTRKYQMGINKYHDFLSQHYDIRALVADKDGKGNILGKYPNWTGRWEIFRERTNYDAFLLSLKKEVEEQV
ncbi:hypothetical protein DYBT9275_04647 [Dyadobacter sp. CECT 9275]|uniref:Uncharacterized protein n=1 Tax=Dyadobacter helix TaxID=2822344 RepID=A0A916JFN8_9BACT|nr:hypothetical protein [Dyadobacter sp. CECT 9275]CAG5010114.1 hypothetical protein DYBT9275_04647 [Dyadobacter sp. CECT 9275]